MAEFVKFKESVAKQWTQMCKSDILYRTQASKDEMWEKYLDSFPEGTNPIFRERREYDCNSCKQFVRAVGNVVAVKDGKMVSIWDIKTNNSTFQTVADSVADFVKSHTIENVFLHTEKTAGVDKHNVFEDGKSVIWNHFFVNIPNKFIAKANDIGTLLGKKRATFDVMKRGIQTITQESIDTVVDLIGQNSLYRGEEHLFAVKEFSKLKKKAEKAKNLDLFVWEHMDSVVPSISLIRNTVIGTLLVDLSDDVDIEKAVKSFETKVAPTNYKRPTAIVTKAMVEQAKKKVEELGLTSALHRRFAKLEDITINNVLYADRQTKQIISDDVFDQVAKKAQTKKKSFDKVEEVTIEKFIADILPNSETIEVMLDNKHRGNFVSLIAPQDATAKNLFKWGNNFSWSYVGEVADSIKERVKNAGGNIDAEFCCRLAWSNHDDLDLHMREAGDYYKIYYGNKEYSSPCGGQLDVDMNAGTGTLVDNPVENIFYRDISKMKKGHYTLLVNNYTKRESANGGFEVEVDILGTTYNFAYDKNPECSQTVEIAKFYYDGKELTIVDAKSSGTQKSKEIWGVQTNQFQKVSSIMFSPNHWDDNKIGNKHFFFMLEGCQNDGNARGFYNEFLKEELNPHRKVLEMVGNATKFQDCESQLSGVGFSSTQRNELICRVTGNFTRTIKIKF